MFSCYNHNLFMDFCRTEVELVSDTSPSLSVFKSCSLLAEPRAVRGCRLTSSQLVTRGRGDQRGGALLRERSDWFGHAALWPKSWGVYVARPGSLSHYLGPGEGTGIRSQNPRDRQAMEESCQADRTTATHHPTEQCTEHFCPCDLMCCPL